MWVFIWNLKILQFIESINNIYKSLNSAAMHHFDSFTVRPWSHTHELIIRCVLLKKNFSGSEAMNVRKVVTLRVRKKLSPGCITKVSDSSLKQCSICDWARCPYPMHLKNMIDRENSSVKLRLALSFFDVKSNTFPNSQVFEL